MSGGAPGVAIAIPGYQVNQDEQVVTYLVQVVQGDTSWPVRRRYQDFVRLHAAARKAAGGLGGLGAAELPDLPPKKMRLGLAKYDPAFLEDRRARLEAYLAALVRLLPPYACEAVDDFLDFADHALVEATDRLEEVRELQAVVRLLRQASASLASLRPQRPGGCGGSRRVGRAGRRGRRRRG
jgi:hypothetical protein